MPLCFQKNFRGKIGKSGARTIRYSWNTESVAESLFVQAGTYVVGVPFVSASEGSRARPGEEKKAMEPLHFLCIMI